MGEAFEKTIGPETKVKVSYGAGRANVEVEYEGEAGGAGLKVFIKARALLEPLKEKIKGNIDDMVIDKICDFLETNP